eukprot:TRINITY_DN41724_c0_g2_i1.p1 TRINITY_DN41724_c0_g2~~TRINITY_DN41724_c0_g2_i1.p1  ORF type:complete len:985 (-),score=188.53 TRINITY_DN41724_c0_g2_i1:81-3035(-)
MSPVLPQLPHLGNLPLQEDAREPGPFHQATARPSCRPSRTHKTKTTPRSARVAAPKTLEASSLQTTATDLALLKHPAYFLPPAILSARRRKDDQPLPPVAPVSARKQLRPIDASTKERDLLPEHEESLLLPIGMDRLWLLLPAGKRPAPQAVLNASKQRALSVEDSLALGLLGDSGLRLLSVLRATEAAEPRPYSPTPSQITAQKRLAATLEHDSGIDQLARLLAGTGTRYGRKRQKSDVSEQHTAAWQEVTAPEGTAMDSMGDGQICVAAKNILDIGGAWRSAHSKAQSRSAPSLDERALAVAVLACQTRPAHRSLLIDGADLQLKMENLKLFAFFPLLEKLSISEGTLASLKGIESCAGCLQQCHIFNCQKLQDVFPLSACRQLQSLDLGGCQDLRSIHGLLSLPELRQVGLRGCTRVPLEELVQMYNILMLRINWRLHFPSGEIARMCAGKMPRAQRQQLMQDARKVANDWLDGVADTLRPPITCSWDEYATRKTKLASAVNEVLEYGGPSTDALHAAWDQQWRSTGRLHIARMTSEDRSVLKWRAGSGGPPRLRRVVNLMSWLKVRRLDGLLRADFVDILTPQCQESEGNISRVYNFFDLKRMTVLRREDFLRLGQGFAGPATGAAVQSFREWAHSRAPDASSSMRVLFRDLALSQESYDEDLDYNDFVEGLAKLEYPGGNGDELFALLADHRPKATDVKATEFEGLEKCFLEEVKRFQKWMIEAHGSWEAAYKAMDLNKNKQLHVDELRRYFRRQGDISELQIEDRVRGLKLVDFSDSNNVSRLQFEKLANLDLDKMLEDLGALVDICVDQYGSLHTAFARFCALSAPDSALKQIATKKSKAAARAVRNYEKSKKSKVKSTKALPEPTVVCYAQFQGALEAIDFRPETDTRVLFRYIDGDMEDSITAEEWAMLPTLAATRASSRTSFSTIKDLLLKKYGSFDEAFTSMARDGKLAEEARAKKHREQVEKAMREVTSAVD